MERAPAKLPNTSSRLIAMAASLVGQSETVRAAMRCTHDDFRLYCEGKKDPSYAELDQLVNLIIEEQRKIIARNRELLANVRRRHQSGSS